MLIIQSLPLTSSIKPQLPYYSNPKGQGDLKYVPN